MDNKDAQEKSGESCCATKKCCGCKALAAIALLAVGGLGGFFIGHHCRACPAPAPAAAAPVK